jgi:hypothetical protein
MGQCVLQGDLEDEVIAFQRAKAQFVGNETQHQDWPDIEEDEEASEARREDVTNVPTFFDLATTIGGQSTTRQYKTIDVAEIRETLKHRKLLRKRWQEETAMQDASVLEDDLKGSSVMS